MTAMDSVLDSHHHSLMFPTALLMNLQHLKKATKSVCALPSFLDLQLAHLTVVVSLETVISTLLNQLQLSAFCIHLNLSALRILTVKAITVLTEFASQESVLMAPLVIQVDVALTAVIACGTNALLTLIMESSALTTMSARAITVSKGFVVRSKIWEDAIQIVVVRAIDVLEIIVCRIPVGMIAIVKFIKKKSSVTCS